MPAHEYINQEQLRGLYAHGFHDPKVKDLDADSVWDQFDDHTYESLHDSIKNEGMKTPLDVSLTDNMLYDGHHRAVIARDLNLNKIPIRRVEKTIGPVIKEDRAK